MRLKLEEEYMQNTKNHEEEVQLHTAIQPAGTATWHCDGQRCRAPQDSEGTAAEVFEHGGEDLQMHTEGS